jgi:hypothetical protein
MSIRPPPIGEHDQPNPNRRRYDAENRVLYVTGHEPTGYDACALQYPQTSKQNQQNSNDTD